MYKIGDMIVYGTSGVCRVADVGPVRAAHASEGRKYYTLEPVYGTETIYIPVDTTAFMRPVMSRREAEELIAQIPLIQEDPANIHSLQSLVEHYQSSFQQNDCAELIHLIKALYVKGQSAQQAGRKPSQVDQRYRKRAEDLLHGELAVALGIQREEVPDFIRQSLRDGPQCPVKAARQGPRAKEA